MVNTAAANIYDMFRFQQHIQSQTHIPPMTRGFHLQHPPVDGARRGGELAEGQCMQGNLFINYKDMVG